MSRVSALTMTHLSKTIRQSIEEKTTKITADVKVSMDSGKDPYINTTEARLAVFHPGP